MQYQTTDNAKHSRITLSYTLQLLRLAVNAALQGRSLIVSCLTSNKTSSNNAPKWQLLHCGKLRIASSTQRYHGAFNTKGILEYLTKYQQVAKLAGKCGEVCGSFLNRGILLVRRANQSM